jgi:hypothetical protein
LKRLAAIALVLFIGAPAVADAAALHVTPSPVPAGDVVRVFGSVGGGCARGDSVTLFSRAFNPRHEFAGVPAIFARAGRNGGFSTTTTIPLGRAAGLYSVGGRCGGGAFGHANLRVNRSPFIDAAPASVRAGQRVRLFGSVRSGCPPGDTVTLFSRALNPRQEFAGVPAVFARVGPSGGFSVTTTIPGSRAPGSYSVGVRCGGGTFGHTRLHVAR